MEEEVVVESEYQQVSDVDAIVDVIANDSDGGSEYESSTDETNLFNVKINGKELKVSRDELIAEYQKGKSSGERFEEAARMRREAETQLQRYGQYEQALENQLDQFAQVAEKWIQEKQPDWSDLLENNPHEYLRKQEEYRQRSLVLHQAQQARMQLNQQQEQRNAEQLGVYIESEKQKLVNELIPEWKSPKVRESEEQALISYLKGSGYTDQDIQTLNYSRANNISLARKAMLYDQAREKAKALKNSQDAVPVTPTATLGGKSQNLNRSIADPNLSFDDFAKLRRAQIAKRR